MVHESWFSSNKAVEIVVCSTELQIGWTSRAINASTHIVNRVHELCSDVRWVKSKLKWYPSFGSISTR